MDLKFLSGPTNHGRDHGHPGNGPALLGRNWLKNIHLDWEEIFRIVNVDLSSKEKWTFDTVYISILVLFVMVWVLWKIQK